MRIGFHAPLKAPDHPVPSGDRQMGRALLAAFALAGHEVTVYSRLRTYAADPAASPLAALHAAADAEVGRLSALWDGGADRPDVLFTYHLYYKAPDLLGPALARRFALPYVTAEATLSRRRAHGPWGDRQALVEAAVGAAAANICFTARDREGLAGTARPRTLVEVPAFIDTRGFGPKSGPSAGGPVRLVTVAMMRPGDKLDSYGVLAAALAAILSLDWHLTIVGDGPAREAVRGAFAGLPSGRVAFVGALAAEAVGEALAVADLLVWPGLGEAFGLCYLEAQACGLPVVAIRNAGTPSVIEDGETGLLTGSDPAAFAAAVARLVVDRVLRERLGARAAAVVHGSRSVPVASAALDRVLRDVVEGR